MISKVLYYFSVLFIGVFVFVWLRVDFLQQKKRALEIQEKIETRHSILKFDDRLAEGKEYYSYYRKRYKHNPKKQYFACTTIRNESEKMCLSVKDSRYLLFYIYKRTLFKSRRSFLKLRGLKS